MDGQIRNSLPPPPPPLHAPILPSALLLAHAKNRYGLLELGSSVKEGLCMLNKSIGDISKCEIRDEARETKS